MPKFLNQFYVVLVMTFGILLVMLYSHVNKKIQITFRDVQEFRFDCFMSQVVNGTTIMRTTQNFHNTRVLTFVFTYESLGRQLASLVQKKKSLCPQKLLLPFLKNIGSDRVGPLGIQNPFPTSHFWVSPQSRVIFNERIIFQKGPTKTRNGC